MKRSTFIRTSAERTLRQSLAEAKKREAVFRTRLDIAATQIQETQPVLTQCAGEVTSPELQSLISDTQSNITNTLQKIRKTLVE